jgi:hypothetical protein
MSRAEAKKRKSSIEYKFLQEYRAAIITDDDIDRFFNLLRVNFVLNEKENHI